MMPVNVRAFVIVLVIMVMEDVRAASSSRVKLVDKGYEGVVIGISPNIPEDQGMDIIEALKKTIKEASEHLYTATEPLQPHNGVYFKDVKIVIPKSWTFIPADEPATTEHFLDSDIRVDEPDCKREMQVYTKLSTGCGQGQEYIHLTPDFLKEDKVIDWWGPRGKQLVPLWATYRWGVFDEIGYPGDPEYPLFALNKGISGKKEQAEYLPNFCTDEKVEGEEYDIEKKKKGKVDDSCDEKQNSVLPNDYCRFNASKGQTSTTSLMSYPSLNNDNIIHFCDKGKHKDFLPTRQNRLCDKKSVVEVMKEHEDFNSSRTVSPAGQRKDPIIKVVQEQDPSYALVMDYSGSMQTNNRIGMLQKTVRHWLLYEVPENSGVALIKFSATATLLAPLTIINRDTRGELADKIQTVVEGYTSVGAGLQEALKVLSGKHNKNVLLISDGEENREPHMIDVQEELFKNKISVFTIALGPTAEKKLEDLVNYLGGKSYTVNDNDNSGMMDSSFRDINKNPIDILINKPKDYSDAMGTLTESFTVDKTLGKDLTFRLDTNPKSEPPQLTDPSGKIYTANSTDFDPKYLVWKIVIPVAESGEWEWKVNLPATSNLKATVTARQLDSSQEAIKVRSWKSFGAVTKSVSAYSLYAEATQGPYPVVNAHVKLTVTPPDDVPGGPTVYYPKDDGKFADVMKDDGIYSIYMTHVPGGGRFNIEVEVTGTNDTLVSKCSSDTDSQGRRRRRSTRSQYLAGPPTPCCGSYIPVDLNASVPTGSFTRLAAGGSAKITNPPVAGSDPFPPVAVRDLQVMKIDVYPDNGGPPTATITWTATGDDLTDGTVSNYDIRICNQNEILSDTLFSQWKQINVSKQELMDAGVLVESGIKVNLTVPLPVRPQFKNIYLLALRAIDDADNESDISNVALFTVESQQELPEWAMKKITEMRKAMRQG